MAAPCRTCGQKHNGKCSAAAEREQASGQSGNPIGHPDTKVGDTTTGKHGLIMKRVR